MSHQTKMHNPIIKRVGTKMHNPIIKRVGTNELSNKDAQMSCQTDMHKLVIKQIYTNELSIQLHK